MIFIHINCYFASHVTYDTPRIQTTIHFRIFEKLTSPSTFAIPQNYIKIYNDTNTPKFTTKDEIQRARHLARDPTFYRWPPAIRLFHPFLPRSLLPDGATSLADFIDRYRLEPFEITLSTLTIVPHQEALEEIETE